MDQFKHETASKVLKVDYNANGFLWMFGSISLDTEINVRKRLVRENDLSKIASLKSGIDSQVEFGKQINIIFAISTFILSTILAPLTFYLQQSIKTIDWQHEVRMVVTKEELSIAKNNVEKEAILSKLTDQISEDSDNYHEGLLKMQDLQSKMLLIIFIPLIFIFVAAIMRFKWLLSLSTCVENAFTEKKEQELKSKSRREDILRRC
ncbi:hypothetical protein [Paenibacillus solani]|uniref:Uncharacterized protein n=1 Tax=Paenibacillus solani TaxID=1705565 RepID=A0A0M1P1W7_9BACL|nr:hypothetical protein [Paenibacillus solani]KOR88295.1 hypothetical protein AM231_03490 [Paenibacillus solani]